MLLFSHALTAVMHFIPLSAIVPFTDANNFRLLPHEFATNEYECITKFLVNSHVSVNGFAPHYLIDSLALYVPGIFL